MLLVMESTVAADSTVGASTADAESPGADSGIGDFPVTLGEYELHSVLPTRSGTANSKLLCGCESANKARQVVAKELARGPSESNADQQPLEALLMSKTNHPHVMPLLDVHERGGRMFLVMPRADGGDLFNQITFGKGIPEATAKMWFAQLLLAVEHLHCIGIVHLDIKPDNVMLHNGQVLLSDFGKASEFSASEPLIRATYGTKEYRGPEAVSKYAHGSVKGARRFYRSIGIACDPSTNPLVFGPELDVWALGCTLYVMLTGRFPFVSTTSETFIKELLFADPRYDRLSGKAEKLLRKMLQKDPSKRISMRDLVTSRWLAKEMATVRTAHPEGNASTSAGSAPGLPDKARIAMQPRTPRERVEEWLRGEHRTRSLSLPSRKGVVEGLRRLSGV